MNWKTLVIMATMLTLFIAPAFAATITVTWNKPTSGTTYSNSAANRQTIDLNFGFTDDNATAGSDKNVAYFKVIRKSDWTTMYTLKSDSNLFAAVTSPTAQWTCTKNGAAAINGSCSYNWTMPLDSELANGDYCLDVNVVRYYNNLADGKVLNQGDENALDCFIIYTGFTYASQTRSLLLNANIILVAAIMVFTIFSISVLQTDPTKTLMAAGIGTISISIITMLIGYFAAML